MKENLLKLYRFSNSWTGTIIIVLLVIFFVAQAFVIPSGSMIRTLLIGDHLFVKKVCLRRAYTAYSVFGNSSCAKS